MGYDAAMVSLDLAILYLKEDRVADVQRLAEEMLPIFQAQDVHREDLAALRLFQEAAQRQELTVEKVRELAAWLRRWPRSGPRPTVTAPAIDSALF
jgi:hypothetical protein